MVTTKRNMTTSKISTITIATTPPDRAATFNASPITMHDDAHAWIKRVNSNSA